MTEQNKAQEINSVIQKIQQSVDTLSEVAMSSFDYDAFVKDEKTGRYVPADETERQLEME